MILGRETQEYNSPFYDFKMGSLFFSIGLFRKSLPHFKKALDVFLEKRDFSSYFSCYDLMLQALNELDELGAVKALKQNVEKVCEIHNISDTSRVLSCSAYYNIYIEKDFQQAKDALNKALKMAFDDYDKYKENTQIIQQSLTLFEIMRCLYVYSLYYFEIKDYKNCIQELKHLKIFVKEYFKLKKNTELVHSKTNNLQEQQRCHNLLQELKRIFPSVQRIKLSMRFSEALIAINYLKKYKRAEKLLWEVYEEANNTHNSFLVPYILCAMTYCCLKLKNRKEAQMFFHLVERQVHKDRKLLLRYICSLKKQENLSVDFDKETYDIVFDTKEHTIIEKHKGFMELKNQFVLQDLLKLFLLNPGVSYSKHQIIKKVWKQNYTPNTHDNKIYVTIKRLRTIIENDPCKPRYICRTSSGYCFSKQARVFIKW